MNTITHTVDQAVLNFAETGGLVLSCNVPDLLCYEFQNFDGSVSVLVADGRYVQRVRAKVIDQSKTDGSYYWCEANLTRNDRPSVLDRDWMRDMFKAINEVARHNLQQWYDMGNGFAEILPSNPPLKFK